MKKRTRRTRRQIFVFTPDEKKAIACILAALLVGLVTQHYRETHLRSPAPPTAREELAAKRIARKAAARTRSARGRAAATLAERTTPSPIPENDDDE